MVLQPDVQAKAQAEIDRVVPRDRLPNFSDKERLPYVGCVVAELASLRPIFKGEEAKLDAKKNVPFQKDQLIKIMEVLGTPNGQSGRSCPVSRILIPINLDQDWSGLVHMPEYPNMKRIEQ